MLWGWGLPQWYDLSHRGGGYLNGMICLVGMGGGGGVPKWYVLWGWVGVRGYHNGMICREGGYHNVTICLVGEGVTTMV